MTAIAQEHQKGTLVMIRVRGLCVHCKHRIEEAAVKGGARQAEWNMNTKLLKMEVDSESVLENVRAGIAATGHDVDDRPGDDAAYAALPECCHYRGKEQGNDARQAATPTYKINGQVFSSLENGGTAPLAGANIYTVTGNAFAQSDPAGAFTITVPMNDSVLVVSHAGFSTDTLMVRPGIAYSVVMHPGSRLEEVIVRTHRRSTFVSTIDPVRTQVMTERELVKAACCNLSETFETNPSVDVTYNDAVTGSKQIQLLGLSGNYTQLTVENLPGPRGLATPLGLSTIAGPWIESIQLTKGIGPVVNGFESIAGQINVELKKPEQGERLFANAYVNDFGKTDLNLNLTKKLGERWSVALLLHDDFLANKSRDFNNDGFRDLPYGNQFAMVNRWNYQGTQGFSTQFGIKFLDDRRTGGETSFNPSTDRHSTSRYGIGISMERYEGFAKIGYVFPGKKMKSIGLQLSSFAHRQSSYFGLTDYLANQDNLYANLIYQSIINTTAHKFRTGMSLVHDVYDERIAEKNFRRTESVPGVFFEYTFSPVEKFNLVAGIRADHHSLFGYFLTPRLHARYQPFQGTTIRLSAGRGQRTANIFAENTGVLASSRRIEVIGNEAGKAYGLDPEVAWNKGISIDQRLRLFNRSATACLDFFRNDFNQQVVVDIEQPGSAKFYNLDGRSFSNSLQAEVTFEPLKQLEARIAYRFFDVRSTYAGTVLQRPLISRHRAFMNLAYTLGRWKFDQTLTINGSKRIPSTVTNPSPYQREALSPAYVMVNAQVSTTIGKKRPMEFYIGGENLGNFFQQNAIIAAGEPFCPYFDASLIWGPVSGRMFYAGWRFKVGN